MLLHAVTTSVVVFYERNPCFDSTGCNVLLNPSS